MAGRHITYRGHSIFVRESRRSGAEPLLLIHGFPTSSWDWEAVWPALAERFHLYTLDLIGFGLSAKPTDYTYSLFDQASLCEAFLAAEGVRSYHVLAHDYGDTVAQELLARQEEPGERPRLSSVAFLKGGLFPETHHPVLIQRLLLSPLGPMISKLASRAGFAKNMRKIFGPNTPPDDDVFFVTVASRIVGMVGASDLAESSAARDSGAIDDAPHHGWTVVDMKQDWKVIYPAAE